MSAGRRVMRATAGWGLLLSTAVALVAGLVMSCGSSRAQAATLKEDPFVQQGEKLLVAEIPKFPEDKAALGSSVAISADGNTLLLGAPQFKEKSPEIFAGAAWVFVRSGSSLSLIHI